MTTSAPSDLSSLLAAARRALADRPGVPLALATLVDVEGSSFRQPGARLLVDVEGRLLAGAISGGCLEADVASRAVDVCAHGTPALLVYDLRDDLQAIWGFDAACDGVAHILLEPLTSLDWLETAVRLRDARIGACVVTVVRAGSESHEARAVTSGAGSGDLPVGTWAVAPFVDEVETACGMGALPSVAHDALRNLHRAVAVTQRATLRECDMAGRRVVLFGDPVTPRVALHVVGAGRGAESFARLGVTLGWSVTIVDHREALLDSLTVPPGVATLVARARDAHRLVADSHSAVALMTHIFEIDREWLAALLPMHHAYIGVLGSRQRAVRLLETVPEADRTLLRTVHAPIGLDIGGESPESIALAAIAEIHATLHARPGGSLRERRSPIHERTPTPVAVDDSSVSSRELRADSLSHASAVLATPLGCRLPE